VKEKDSGRILTGILYISIGVLKVYITAQKIGRRSQTIIIIRVIQDTIRASFL
jgi:hypothetical protein